MDQDRWRAVNHIFHAALELSPSERGRFVSAASDGDAAVENEVKLLLAADAEAGSYIERPLMAAGALAAMLDDRMAELVSGDLLCGRFRIVRELGEGGMGTVFAALDEELGVQVALKTIRAEVAASPEALARFRQEVNLARRITHPNVCRTFDLERDPEALEGAGGKRRVEAFLTMELLDGETLAERIRRRGALSPGEAAEVARQVASGLDAARALGVVHRDIKPGNIILCPVPEAPGFRAVITDFGLARADSSTTAEMTADSQDTSPSGTLAYMAPEQLEGKAVSPATDIYAFGLVLFEMVTGQRAFPSDRLLSGITRRLGEGGTTPDPAANSPGLPRSWSRAIDGCLQVSPERRFASAAEAVAVLEGRAGRPAPQRAIRSVAWSIVSACIAVALFWAEMRIVMTRRGSTVDSGSLVYLSPLQDQTGEKLFASITELMRIGLTQSAHIHLLDASRVADTLQRMTKSPDAEIDPVMAREVAMRTGAVRVILVSMTGSRGRYQLNVELQQPDNTPTRWRNRWTTSFPWQSDTAGASTGSMPAGLLKAVRDANDWIRLEAGESPSDISRLDVPPEDVTTGNWEALEEYLSAEKFQKAQQTTKAVLALENAVAIDPHFSLALGRLGDLLFSMGKFEDGYRAYERALASGENRRLSRKERDRISGEFALDIGDYATAERAYRDMTIFYEDDYTGWSYRGFPLMMMGRVDEAVESLSKAYGLDPLRSNAPWELGRANLVKGNTDEALRWADVLERHGTPDTANYIRGAVKFMKGDFEGADRNFAEMQSSTNPVVIAWSYQLRTRVAAESEDYARAESQLEQGIEFNRSHGQIAFEADDELDRAYIEAITGNTTEAIKMTKAALALDHSPARICVASEILGETRAKSSNWPSTRIVAELTQLMHLLPRDSGEPFFQMARSRLMGEKLLAEGDAAAAIVQFKKAAQLDAPANSRAYLGRALEFAGKHSSHPEEALEFRQAAADAYSVIALTPGLLWLDSSESLPGTFRKQLNSLASLEIGLPDHEKESAQVRSELNLLDAKICCHGSGGSRK